MLGTMRFAPWILLLASTASAQSPVDAGWRLYEEAEFTAALEAFDEAEARGSLTAQEWIRLLEGRALVHFARGELDAMRATLGRLARVAPDHALAADAPPEIIRAFLEARESVAEPLRLELRGERQDGAFELEASLLGDRGDLVLSLRTFARAEGASWTQSDERVRIEADAVEAYAEALGPGGAVVRARGSASEPMRFALERGPDVRPGGPNWRLIFGVAGGALGAVLLGTVIAVLATRDPDTQPNPPQVVE